MIGRGAGAEEAGDEPERGADLRRRIETGGERGGDADEPLLLERAIDRSAVPLDDIERRPVKPPEHAVPMPRPIRPNSNPARILEKRVSKKSRRRIEVVTNEWSNFHRGMGSSPKMLTPRQQGDFGELSAALTGWRRAARTSRAPVRHTTRLGTSWPNSTVELLRVQVKTSPLPYRRGRWEVRVLHARRQSELEWSGQAAGPAPVRSTCSCSSEMAAVGSSRPSGSKAVTASRSRRPQVRRVRGRARRSDSGLHGPKKPSLQSPPDRSGGCPSGQRSAAVNRVALPTQVRILLPPLTLTRA